MDVLTVGHLAARGEIAAVAPSGSGSTSPWVIVALAVLGSSVVAGVVTTVLGNLRTAATVRRDGYVKAVRTLIARGEYPYRVRRRVSDDGEVLGALVARGHDLQEQLAECWIWVASQNQVLGSLFEEALISIDATVQPSTMDAWNQAPIATAAGMNLGGWGPGDQRRHVAKLERAIAFQFGWRRLVPSWIWTHRL